MDLWLGHDFHFICRVFLCPISDNLTRHARLRRREIGRRERETVNIYQERKIEQDEELKAPHVSCVFYAVGQLLLVMKCRLYSVCVQIERHEMIKDKINEE